MARGEPSARASDAGSDVPDLNFDMDEDPDDRQDYESFTKWLNQVDAESNRSEAPPSSGDAPSTAAASRPTETTPSSGSAKRQLCGKPPGVCNSPGFSIFFGSKGHVQGVYLWGMKSLVFSPLAPSAVDQGACKKVLEQLKAKIAAKKLEMAEILGRMRGPVLNRDRCP